MEFGVNAVKQNRKERIEQVLAQAYKTPDAEQAWRRLCRELEFLSEPEARMPKFDKLLHALWIAATNDQT